MTNTKILEAMLQTKQEKLVKTMGENIKLKSYIRSLEDFIQSKGLSDEFLSYIDNIWEPF